MSNTRYGNISSDALREAADIRDQIDSLNAQLRAILTGGNAAEAVVVAPKRRGRPPGSKNLSKADSAPKKKRGGKRTMSAEGRERIRAAQKARWAKIKKQG